MARRTRRECCDITAASHRFPWAVPWRIPRNPLTTEVPAVDSNDSPDETRTPFHPDTVGSTLTGGASASVGAGQIGPYRLLRVLGEGGMGQVWLAEQRAPIQRTVALKLIKAGMDTKAVVARFESERQALALMDHPNIAQVYEAGSTPEGRPYFVMEYVQGLPITEYCDKHRLSMKDRLQLFMQVCEGVQHAHQKAIIHRDLKPSNVMVVQQNDKAIPKIIDFGLAKAMAQRLTENTVVHGAGRTGGDARVHEPRAGGSAGARHRHAHGCVFARRDSVRTARRSASVRYTSAACRGSRSDSPHDPGRDTAKAEYQGAADGRELRGVSGET